MQLKIFNIPIGADDALVEDLNHFLRANKIVDIKKELASVDGNNCWSFCVTYILPNRIQDADFAKSSSKVDYKEVLDADAFERFSSLRKIRKQIAEREAVPAFAVFTDAELAEMAKQPVVTLESMRQIAGIGAKKIEKYGAFFVEQTASVDHET